MKSNVDAILEKSIACAVSAIEIYNKPDFKYREETFSILMINAWELVLKAKKIKDNNNNINLDQERNIVYYCQQKFRLRKEIQKQLQQS